MTPDLVVPDTSLSVYDHAIAPWRGTGYKKFYQKLVNNAYEFDFPLHRPYFDLTQAQKQLLWDGNRHFTGIDAFLKNWKPKTIKFKIES